MPNRHLAFALMALVGLSLTLPLSAQPKQSVLPNSLTAAIKTVASAAVIVEPQDVDAAACQPVGESPGLLRADFNGDGRDDYAVLLKMKETGKEKRWDGRTLREARFSFVLFLDDGSGGYRPRVIRQYTDFMPTAVVLDLQPAGNVRHRETRKNVHIPNAGVMLSFCEKSAKTYYLVDDKVRSVPIAD
jgi:hypothetical protein